ncbi:hypothetical protein Tco_0378890 [Tanacetum coccineum]
MAALEVPQTLEYKGGQLNVALVLEGAFTVKAAWLGFWPTIGDGEFILWGTSVKKIRDPKKSLVTMEIIMELDGGTCCWPTAGQVRDDDEVEKEAEGFAETYQSMSRRDWQVRQRQWMDHQDRRWGQMETWMNMEEERANWMYDHVVRHF